VALRLGLWERTARTEILEQSISAPRILSADVADAIEALGRILINAQMSGLGAKRKSCARPETFSGLPGKHS
jgi:hypothetical protein